MAFMAIIMVLGLLFYVLFVWALSAEIRPRAEAGALLDEDFSRAELFLSCRVSGLGSEK